ncbi:hypothetical protein LIER_11644 [Lithospermum erythrorhizon]|uniref:Uncharacterized protein n=1 Tax=Lithospermum erythrorhizon TaxID=34254 RepID=A0AAV3PSU4_LITER
MDVKWMIQQVSSKIIKPSIPTPSHLRTYMVSLLDQLTVASYIPVALFYPQNKSSNQISQILEKSLSEILTSYYPFCGTLSADGNSVECNDKGASFSEVVIKCPMSEFIKETNVRFQDLVFSNKLAWGNSCPEDYLLFVQLTHFECGGKALSFRISHRIADACSLVNFLTDYATLNAALLLSDGGHAVYHERPSPQFIGASLLPPTNGRPSPSFTKESNEGVVCKRFTFSGKSLAQLKALVAAEDDDLLYSSSGTNKPRYITRVELVTALLFKCAVAATAKACPQLQGSTLLIKPSNLMQVANLRRLTTPQLAPNVVGNWYTYMDLVVENEDQMKLSRFVKELKKEKLELKERMKKYYNGCSKNDLSKQVVENDEKMAVRYEKDVYLCSSFCGYPLYEIDFGFGKPIWTILGSVYTEKVFFLMDNPEGDGVEALVTLEEKVMSLFENEEEISTFSSFI